MADDPKADEPVVVEYPKHVKNADGDTVTVNSKEEEAKVKAGAKKAEKAAEKHRRRR